MGYTIRDYSDSIMLSWTILDNIIIDHSVTIRSYCHGPCLTWAPGHKGLVGSWIYIAAQYQAAQPLDIERGDNLAKQEQNDMGVSEHKGVPYIGVLIIRILLFRVLY